MSFLRARVTSLLSIYVCDSFLSPLVRCSQKPVLLITFYEDDILTFFLWSLNILSMILEHSSYSVCRYWRLLPTELFPVAFAFHIVWNSFKIVLSNRMSNKNISLTCLAALLNIILFRDNMTELNVCFLRILYYNFSVNLFAHSIGGCW
jgi:hypothetical protein